MFKDMQNYLQLWFFFRMCIFYIEIVYVRYSIEFWSQNKNRFKVWNKHFYLNVYPFQMKRQFFFIAWSEQKMYKWKLFPLVSGFFIFASTILFEFGTYGKAILLHRSRDHIAQHSQTQSHQFLSFSLCRCFVSRA